MEDPARMSGPSIQIEPDATVSSPPLELRFDDEAEFRREFEGNLASGATFVATKTRFARRQNVDVTLDFAFCGERVSVPAEVILVVEPAFAEVSDSEPGVSVRFLGSVTELKALLESATGLDLSPSAPQHDVERRIRTRTRSDCDIVLATETEEFAGNTANISYTGVLAMLPMTSVPTGTVVRVELSNPMVELDLAVDGRIVHSRRCDGGMIAHGIQLQYPAERIDEVMAFIEFLQSFDRARRLAIVAGPVDAGGLSSILDLFAHTAPSGTLVVSHGEKQGRIVFSENYILRCTAGMATGAKALARLFLWDGGRFEFHHELQLAGAPEEPQPLEAAMMMASVQVDELRRIGIDDFHASDTFALAAPEAGPDREKLSELECELLDYVADGFTVEAISDMIPAPDAEIYRMLVGLLAAGVIERQG
jgi:Tfp pilus assembly protein PilZ